MIYKFIYLQCQYKMNLIWGISLSCLHHIHALLNTWQSHWSLFEPTWWVSWVYFLHILCVKKLTLSTNQKNFVDKTFKVIIVKINKLIIYDSLWLYNSVKPFTLSVHTLFIKLWRVSLLRKSFSCIIMFHIFIFNIGNL